MEWCRGFVGGEELFVLGGIGMDVRHASQCMIRTLCGEIIYNKFER